MWLQLKALFIHDLINDPRASRANFGSHTLIAVHFFHLLLSRRNVNAINSLLAKCYIVSDVPKRLLYSARRLDARGHILALGRRWMATFR